MSTGRPRGPYAKTAERRRVILDAALAAYAEAGSRGVSIKDIADRAGLSHTGVVHHFGTREALLTAVLEDRDAAAAEAYGEEAALWRTDMLAANAETPGLVKLFVDLAAAGAEADHPAHDFFVDRYQGLRERFRRAIEDRPPVAERPAPAGGIDAEWAARMLIAATDGLQVQWLLDPAATDIAADIGRLRDVLLDALDRKAERGDVAQGDRPA
ncbi:TetR/AcrR family transcriptional regulator [Streptacidiphilus pinicola]|uniref:TetR/AcrR family transcriptional regulator n=1 Tax=Streptacidiphilus pinicola TaxID=2219663 RepID=UPI0010580C54|nr:TetR/AcrR family transcriptional regulator [Streptacidiphilus pinicola]